MNDLANHLWQSTIFAAAIALITFALRRNSARIRYWLWLAASVKFLIPVSPLVSLGGRVVMPPDTPELPARTVIRISTYFAPTPTFAVKAAAVGQSHWPVVLAVFWFTGSLLLLLCWIRRWYTIHQAARSARLMALQELLPVLSSATMIEPGIFGIFRPVLLLPEGIIDNLTPEQFEAVLAHELCHVRCRDNLTAALHMCVEAIFWFHPLVWWIGAKMIEERERDCDESVLARGSRPGDYAQGILKVCRSYVESPLPCAAGITGDSLKKRVREIMTWRGSIPVSFLGKLTLTAAGIAAATVPFVIGIIRAQTLPPPPAYTYDVVSIRPASPGQIHQNIGPGPQGGLRMQNVTAMLMLTFAYGVRDYQVVGAPGWVSSRRFDISFTPDKGESTPKPGIAMNELQAFMSRNRQRTQAVLRDRFGLVLRAETHALPIYNLVLAKAGHKLSSSPDGNRGPSLQANAGQVTAIGVTMTMLADYLSAELSRPVTNATGLEGQYDFKLEWTPDSPVQPSPNEPAGAAGGPSIFTALTEQLGLRLESGRGPVPVYVIEKIDTPSEN
jgi:bla regulator protein blaR1